MQPPHAHLAQLFESFVSVDTKAEIRRSAQQVIVGIVWEPDHDIYIVGLSRHSPHIDGDSSDDYVFDSLAFQEVNGTVEQICVAVLRHFLLSRAQRRAPRTCPAAVLPAHCPEGEGECWRWRSSHL